MANLSDFQGQLHVDHIAIVKASDDYSKSLRGFLIQEVAQQIHQMELCKDPLDYNFHLLLK